MTTIKDIEDEIEKGCGRKIDEIKGKFPRIFVCGDLSLNNKVMYCTSCQAQLQLIQKIKDVRKEEIDKIDEFVENWRDFFYHEINGYEDEADRMLDDWIEIKEDLLGENQDHSQEPNGQNVFGLEKDKTPDTLSQKNNRETWKCINGINYITVERSEELIKKEIERVKRGFYLNKQPKAVLKLIKMAKQKAIKEELEFLKELLVDVESYSLTKESIKDRIKQLEKEMGE